MAEEKLRLNWINTIFLLGTLAVALVGTPWYIVKHGLGWPETVTFLVLWTCVGLSVTAGYHRLFSHKTFQASWPVRLFFLVFGAAALENSVLNWAADHRIHHSHVDHDRDPYNIQRGFWWAHIGWIFYDVPRDNSAAVRDLHEDPLVVWQHRWYKLIGIGVALGIPLIVGLATGRVLGCLLIGGVARIVASHHTTFFINSACHMLGRQPYSREHSARDSGLMAILAFGEGYHNYHHSFPFDYRNGIKTWHFDPAKWIIFLLEKVGLARDLRRASEAAVLKAKVEVQFEQAQETMIQAGSDLRERYEQRVHDAYARVQAALHELVALQRRHKQPAAASAAIGAEGTGEPHLSLEERVRQTYHAVEQALHEWKQVLQQVHQMPASAAA
ncbi:MAG TPA: fatty acid desaturase [Thermoanaerobaculia bacterium]|nr:fatty acid desaturase [Thermoanaerobaculia bacterium]